MFNFTAHFFDNKIYINNQFIYNNNQFLTEMLSQPICDNVEEQYQVLVRNSDKLMLYTNFSDYEIENYNNVVQKVQRAMNCLDSLFDSLSISKAISNGRNIASNRLYNALNHIQWIWKASPDNSDYDDDDMMSEYGFAYNITDRFGVEREVVQMHTFIPSELEGPPIEGIDEELSAINNEVSDLCISYKTFAEDVLRVKELYTDFVNNYLNAENKFLDDNSLANAYASFTLSIKKLSERNYHKFTSGYSKFSHTVIEDNNKSLLCQSYEFQSIGAFLYFDLFRGIENNYIPRKCDSCGKYFLIKAGKYTSYCDNISPSDKTKTCKEIGSRKRYDDKCKTDPVWQAYNRAYKAHYARYMKKKMTVSEFGKWSDWAIEWRTKAENEEIDFDEYVREIKK